MRKMIQGVAMELKEIPIKGSNITLFTTKNERSLGMQEENRTEETVDHRQEMNSFGGD